MKTVSMSKKRCNPKAIFHNNHLYVVGGDHNNGFNNIEIFNIKI